VASVEAVRVSCKNALRVAARWSPGARAKGFLCSETRHSFDQTVVECVKPRHCRARAVAFVYREPAQAPTLRGALAAPVAPVTEDEPEPLEPDDALPRGEES
jgi:hypothetical protein